MPFSLFGLSTMETLLLLLLLLVLAYLAFRVFQYILKALVVGIVFMAVPFLLEMAGMPVGTDIRTLLWFMIFGVVSFFAFSSVRFGFKATKAVMSPFQRTFSKKEGNEKKTKGKTGKP